MSTERRVVVTGYGAITSLGANADELWQGITNYKLGYARYAFSDEKIGARFFGFIEDNKSRYKPFKKTLLRALPAFGRHALVAADEAMKMAFGDDADLDKYYDPFERGAIVGTGWGGCDSVNDNNAAYLERGLSSPFSTLMSMNSIATAVLAMNWNLRGYQNTPVAACASGTIALGDAFEVIRSGRADMMLAGGSESLKEQFNVWSIDVLQALSKEQADPALACCPFDRRRSGFVLSEGSAVLVLEEYESAKRRDAPILGEIVGYANYTDAEDFTAPAQDMGARVSAIRGACKQAGIGASDIGYINAHGTSTPLNDLNESNAIKLAIGEPVYDIPISSTKSYTGHLIGAAGALETLLCLKTLATGTIPATVNLNEPDPECDLDYTPNQHRDAGQLTHALNLSFGFGGSNAAIVLKRL
jgi:3-oxoacyl-[acyl-carrier-protein] synthase II